MCRRPRHENEVVTLVPSMTSFPAPPIITSLALLPLMKSSSSPPSKRMGIARAATLPEPAIVSVPASPFMERVRAPGDIDRYGVARRGRAQVADDGRGLKGHRVGSGGPIDVDEVASHPIDDEPVVRQLLRSKRARGHPGR